MSTRPAHHHRLVSTAPALTLTLGLALAASLGPAGSTAASPPSARAAVGGLALVYTAAPGQTNRVTIRETYADEYLTYDIDDSVPISIGNGCTYPDSTDTTRIRCTVHAQDTPSPYDSLEMTLGDRNDTVTTANNSGQGFYTNRIDLGSGNDTSAGIGASDSGYTYGGTGNDTLRVGRHGNAYGGDGNDVFFTSGEGAWAEGGQGDDVIHGGADWQVLHGDDGNDTMSGAGGADYMLGGRGTDRLSGGKGNDTLYGNSGNDTLYGNSGNDDLHGGPGVDRISGGPGNDTVHQ